MSSRWLPTGDDGRPDPVICSACTKWNCCDCTTDWCGCTCRMPGGQNYAAGGTDRAYMDDNEPIFCMTCKQTTRIRCPHVPHRGDGTGPRRSRAGAPRRALMTGVREYRSADTWGASEGSWASYPRVNAETRKAWRQLERARQGR
jgi:hypothetical protein